METIERNAKLQAQLIEELLDVSRILQGKLTLNVAPVNLEFTIKAAIETVRLAVQAKAIDFRFSISDFGLGLNTDNPKSFETNELDNNPKPKIQNPKFLVMGDTARLQQVVWNLLSNAVKFTPNGGQVEIRLSKVMGNRKNRDGADEENYQLPTTNYQLPPTPKLQSLTQVKASVPISPMCLITSVKLIGLLQGNSAVWDWV